ncbi:MAG: helix-turn-helix domain-containing protein [Nocardioidaceae bacterium]|nr:helix-turn-helix domain-containing protein [Nocardioidaceae bacterium]
MTDAKQPPESVPAELAPWLVSYVAEQAQPDHVAAFAGRVTQRIIAEMPELRQFDGLDAAIARAVGAHWMAFLADFAQPTPRFHLVQEAHDIARDVAERQLPLETLIRVYRVAQMEVWDYARDLVQALPSSDFDHADLLIHFWNRAVVWLDRSVTESTDTYQEARTRVLAGAAAHRFESVRAVLAGELDDPREASAALGGYPMSLHHTAVVLSVVDAERAGRLEPFAADVARTLGVANPLVVKPGGRHLWMWLGTRDPLDSAGLDHLGEDHHAVGASAGRSAGITLGVGTPSRGVAGFAASHREALGAQGVARAETAGWLQRYADAELEVLLGCTDAVDRFMARQLGGLLAEGEAIERVRETVSTFLDHGGSAEETARALVVHRNTVRYRLDQAEELTGRPIGKASPTLAVALRHYELFHSSQ